ncbi:MAG: M48 family metallopeptidase [Gammaproteobacteria bacterium]|nr:M48 family metallopeptidase [Gammaproteobacteria bacterium]
MQSITRKAAFLAVFFLASCAVSPTGRDQLLLFSDSELNQMGRDSFSDLKRNTPRVKSHRVNRYVDCVAQSLINVLPNDELSPNAWEVVVFDDDQINAFALPGGYIGVYRGMLEATENQHQLAAVIGHELAHVRAQHGNERVSQQALVQFGLAVAAAGLEAEGVSRPQDWQNAIGLGLQMGVLMPFSRTHELEADDLGMRYMARAGFDPKQGEILWRNMQQRSGSGAPEFMSTHPSERSRIQQIQRQLPHLMELRLTAQQEGRSPSCTL